MTVSQGLEAQQNIPRLEENVSSLTWQTSPGNPTFFQKLLLD